MKKNVCILCTFILLLSCQQPSFIKKFYKTTYKNEFFNLTVLNDSVIAVTKDIKSECDWNFMKYSKNKKGEFYIVSSNLDTTKLKLVDNKLIHQNSTAKITFDEFDIDNTKKDKLFIFIEKVKKLKDKDIIFDCGIKFDEIEYFHDNSISEIKSFLKNPNEVKFINFYIHSYEERNFLDDTTKKTNIKIVTVDIIGSNSFGDSKEETFYVFFTPEQNSKNYSIKSSDSPIYE